MENNIPINKALEIAELVTDIEVQLSYIRDALPDDIYDDINYYMYKIEDKCCDIVCKLDV